MQIEDLKCIAMIFNIPVFCYGLRTDFKSNLFEGSKRLFEIADSISEIKSVCHCGDKAIINARIKDGKIIYYGEQIDIGANDKYIGLCYKCWIEGNLT
jgi:thymidine kinase